MSWQQQAICKNPPCPNQNNQSEPGGESDGVSIPAPAHVASHSPSGACANSVKRCIFSERTQWRTNNHQSTKQWENCPSLLCQQQLTTKTSKQKKTNDETQAKTERIRPSDAAGWGFREELERSGEGGGGTWKLYSKLSFQAKSTLFSILPTAALRGSVLYSKDGFWWRWMRSS